ncbi:MAG: DUF6882 domain-containing protein [Candidatus Methylacidiphilales bacterium]|nr:hypothetical protein [Candidatus Methylacidiphilales bacterium]
MKQEPLYDLKTRVSSYWELASKASMVTESMTHLFRKRYADILADRREFQQECGDLIWSAGDREQARAKVQIAGTHSLESYTWRWAWDNPTIESLLLEDAENARLYGVVHGIDDLTQPVWECSKDHAWVMAAIVFYLNKGRTVFVEQYEHLEIYMIIKCIDRASDTQMK